MRKIKHFINGDFVTGASDNFFELISPVNGEVYALSPQAIDKDVDQAYQAALHAAMEWKLSTPSQRQKALLSLADAIEADCENLVDLQAKETGQLKHFIKQEEICASCDTLRFFAGAARCLEGKASGEYLTGFHSEIRREPLGVVGQVTPWNYPFMMAIWKIAPALAAGNTVVLKPSDTTPLSTLRLAELAAPFFPIGSFNVVLGNAATGQLVVSHPRASLVSITGSVRAGHQVAISAAENLTRSHLELGGKAPAIIFDDADLTKVVSSITTAGYFNAGQDCTAVTRIIAHANIYDDLLTQLHHEIKTIRYGEPDDTTALYGALNNHKQLQQVKGFIERLPNYAKIEIGGCAGSEAGFYFQPTLISGLTQEDEAIQQEIFGPVMTIQRFYTDEEALNLANGVDYGLASSIWTKDHQRAQRFSRDLDFGTVWVNSHIPLCAEMPHGGFKNSGYGKDLSTYSLEEYTRIKHVMSDIS